MLNERENSLLLIWLENTLYQQNKEFFSSKTWFRRRSFQVPYLNRIKANPNYLERSFQVPNLNRIKANPNYLDWLNWTPILIAAELSSKSKNANFRQTAYKIHLGIRFGT